MKKLIISAAAIVFFMLGASEVFACSCLMENEQSDKKKVKTAYKQATAVFHGEVTEVTRQADGLVVKFRVSSFWKGAVSGETIIRTAENSAMCGFNFEIGKQYLVYASGESENLQTNICTRTSAQNADEKYLDKIKKPKSFLRAPRR